MKQLVMTTMICGAFSFSQAFAEDALELEPSINGEVSASGLYATQEEEDKASALSSEACIYGGEAAYSAYTAKIRQNMERSRRLAQGMEANRQTMVSTRCVDY